MKSDMLRGISVSQNNLAEMSMSRRDKLFYFYTKYFDLCSAIYSKKLL